MRRLLFGQTPLGHVSGIVRSTGFRAGAGIKPTLPWLSAIIFALVFIHIFSPVRYQLGVMQLDARASVQWPGDTVIAVPPFGEVWATTHSTPVRITLTLSGLNLPELERTVRNAQDRDDFVQQVSANWQHLALRFGLRLLLLGALGGLCSLVFLRATGWDVRNREHQKHHAMCLPASLMAVGALTGLLLTMATALTFNEEAFERPKYAGVLQAAPWIISLIDRSLDKLDDVGRKLEVISQNLTGIFESVDGIAPMSTQSSDTRVLLVSDLHNNPAGMDFIIQIAENFKADLIVDTGDITDYGTAVEASLAERMGRLKIPYIFIPGNHESPEAVRHLARLRNVIVLDNREIRVKGLRIYGSADPASKKGDLLTTPAEYQEHGAALAAAISRMSSTPDIVAVHSRDSMSGIEGLVPVIVFGHDHRASVQKSGSSVLVNAGTSGAGGIRSFQSADTVPYSVSMLHFRMDGSDPDNRAQLTAVDAIRVYEPRGRLILERHVFHPAPGTAANEAP